MAKYYNAFLKKSIKMMGIMVAVCIFILSGIIIFLWMVSPGRPKQFDQGKILEGSLSEKIFLTIGGVRQGMIIRSKNTDNPVLLYLHGGPAFPNYFLIEKYDPGLEEFFTVCYWEQRGGGLFYTPLWCLS